MWEREIDVSRNDRRDVVARLRRLRIITTTTLIGERALIAQTMQRSDKVIRLEAFRAVARNLSINSAERLQVRASWRAMIESKTPSVSARLSKSRHCPCKSGTNETFLMKRCAGKTIIRETIERAHRERQSDQFSGSCSLRSTARSAIILDRFNNSCLDNLLLSDSLSENLLQRRITFGNRSQLHLANRRFRSGILITRQLI